MMALRTVFFLLSLAMAFDLTYEKQLSSKCQVKDGLIVLHIHHVGVWLLQAWHYDGIMLTHWEFTLSQQCIAHVHHAG